MNKMYIALGTPEKFVKLGDFNVTVKGDEMDIYYNINLGDNRVSMFDVNAGKYKNLEKAHLSYHYSGQGHFKESKRKKILRGHISDGSVLNSASNDLLILGVESFFIDVIAKEGVCDQNTLFLNTPCDARQYSIIWLFVPATHPHKIHPRFIYANLWDNTPDKYSCRTASLADLSISKDMQTILSVNGWEIRALFLKSLLPVMATHEVVLFHPKGFERAWRGGVFIDAHLPISEMIRFEASKKKPVFTPTYHEIPSKAKTPMAWVKQKEAIDGTDTTIMC